MEEKRKFVRLDINVAVEWNKIGDTGEETTDMGKNVSSGGICLIVYEKLETGDRLQLKITFPTGETIEAKGEVVWVRDFEILGSTEKKGYDAGIKFIDLTEKDRDLIDKFVFTMFHTKRVTLESL